jgi:hypothetical protein
MSASASWIQKKLSEACGCMSRKPYAQCCLRREASYFAIGAVAAISLFGGYALGLDLVGAVFAFVLAPLAGWFTKRHFDHKTGRTTS